MGICCIDEFDKMEEGDRTAIHEVMEQQSISIAKSGITTTLNCRTTVLAAANPVFGRYNPYKSPNENIDLPPALLSRFDLLFLLLDTVDHDKDKFLALHVCKVHTTAAQGAEEKQPDKQAAVGAEDGDPLNLGFKPFDSSFMRHFVRKAKSFEPWIENSLQKDIVDAYVSLRDDEKRSDVDSRKNYTTPRTLLAIMRLSQAHARTRFSNRVERQDFEEAMRLLRVSKESIETSAPARKDANPMDVVYDIIADLSRQQADRDGWVDFAHVVSMAGHKAMSEDIVRGAFDEWDKLSVLSFSPDKKKVKFLIPPAA
jgi:DNA replication licensing factor MCM7